MRIAYVIYATLLCAAFAYASHIGLDVMVFLQSKTWGSIERTSHMGGSHHK